MSSVPTQPRSTSNWFEHCKAKLAPYQYPRWFHFIPELPKTVTGKVQRFKLRERAIKNHHDDGLPNAAVA